VRAGEGIVDTLADGAGYQILCPEHMPPGSLDPEKPPEASRLPSIHLGDERFER
jgi:hypothetical protein